MEGVWRSTAEVTIFLDSHIEALALVSTESNTQLGHSSCGTAVDSHAGQGEKERELLWHKLASLCTV